MSEQRRQVLIYSGSDDSVDFYNSVHAILSKLLDEKKYEIKQLKHDDLSSSKSSKSWSTGIDAVFVNNDGGSKKFSNPVQLAFLEYFLNSGKLVFLSNAADGRDALWLLKAAAPAEQGAPFPENVGLAFEKFAKHQPVPANLQSFQLHKSVDPNRPDMIDYAVGLVRGDSDLSYMHFICEDGDTAVFVVSQSTAGFGAKTDPEKGKTESFWRDILRVLRLIGVEVLPISAAQAAQKWEEGAGDAAGGVSPPKKKSSENILIYLGPGKEEKAQCEGLQSALKQLVASDKHDIQILEHDKFSEGGAPWKSNCAVLFVDNRNWETKFDDTTKKLITDYFAGSGKVVFFCDPKEGRKAMWLLKTACAPNEVWPDAVGKAYEHFAQNQPVPTDLQAIQTQKKGEQQVTDLSLGLIKSGNGAFTYLKCEDGDTAVFVAMTVDEVVKEGAFIWSELLRVVGLPYGHHMPPSPFGSNPVVGELSRVVKFINTGASSITDAASSLVDRVSGYFKGESKSMGKTTKPPNLLIYAAGSAKESTEKFQGFSKTLNEFLAPNQYTVYQLKKESILTDQQAPWASNCRTVFVENEKSVDEKIKKAFTDYFFHNDGRLVLFCDPTIGREALWLLEMLAGGQKWPRIVGEAYEHFFRTGERAIPTEMEDFFVCGRDDECRLQFLGGFRGVPPILQFTVGGGPIAAFVGAKFDYLCVEKGQDTWKEVLEAVGLETAKPDQQVDIDAKEVPVGGIFIKNQELVTAVKAKFPDGVIDLPTVKAKLDQQPSKEETYAFKTDEYFQHLNAKRFGQVVVYAPIVPSTMPISDDWHNTIGEHNYVVVAKQQTQGQGRSGNQWLSPIGSALFSFCVHVPSKSSLGTRLSFLQHLVTLAAADSIHQLHEALNIRIKWPNDIYYGNEAKIGGVLVKANFVKEEFVVFVGTGINVSNAAPTACLNKFLPSDAKPLTPECVTALTLSRLEQLIDEFQVKGPEGILALYYKYWLHSNQKVTIASSGEEVTIIGLDEYGFLNVKATGSGKNYTLHPDGNSFDMMANLIKAKESA